MSPEIAAAQATTAPTKMAAAGPTALSLPSRASNKSEVKSSVAMVTPEIGLFDEPTNPAMYPATAAKKKPATSMITAIRRETESCWTMIW